MKLIIDEKVLRTYPTLSFGIVLAKSVNNERKTIALEQIFNGMSAQVRNKMKKSELNDMPRITNWENIYKDISGKTFQTNLEKLLRDVLANREVPFTDNLAKIRDYFMLKWKLPIVCFSLNHIFGDIELTYDGKEVIYKDKGSVLTKKWNSEQYKRGNINRETDSTLFIIENLGILEPEKLKTELNEMALMIQKYCFGSNIEIDMIVPPHNEMELGVAGLSEFTGESTEGSEASEAGESAEEEIPEISPSNTSNITKELPSGDEIQRIINETEFAPAEKPAEQPKEAATPINDNSLKFRIAEMFKEALNKSFPEVAEEIKIEYPRDLSHGDYACSIAMKLSKTLGQNPMEIAEKITSNISPLQFVGNIEVVQPGFINVRLSSEFLTTQVNEIPQKKALIDTKIGQNKTIVIDYSSPNIAKPLGVHHLLSTVIGQAIYNIYNALGYKTIGVNHLGDWGTQFGKLIYAYKTWGDKKTIEKDPIPELLKLYVKFHDEAEKAPEIEDKARLEFKKLEQGDEENTKLWEWFKELSMLDLKATYEKLGIKFDEYIGESFFNDKMAPVIEEGKEKGVFVEGEGGALIVKFEDENMPPYLVQKSDGATLYSLRDLATIKYRLQTWNPEQLLYVVDSAQSLHFKQLFETAKMLGYNHAKFEHISFGRMSLPDKSMSTRKGNVVLLEEVLKDGLEKAREIVKEKSKDLKKKEQEKVAEQVAIGAIKYNILSQNRTTDIVFDWDKMLSIEGNSAPYLQYTYARAESILRKNDQNKPKKEKKKPVKDEPTENQIDLFQAIEIAEDKEVNGAAPLENEHELEVARLLPKFGEILLFAAEEYKPNLFSNYLYELAHAFNGFYNAVPVLHTENVELKEVRLNLCKAVSRTLKQGLHILGIEVPERM
jgi:arginyl-tRNA synthetase